MVYWSGRPQPPRGSTEWGARQFYRLLDHEERIAAERERLIAMGWQAPDSSPTAGPHADEPAFGDERDLYADLIQQRLDVSRALGDEARRRVTGMPSEVGLAAQADGSDWAGIGRFAVPAPRPGDELLIPAFLAHEPPPGGARPMLGVPGIAREPAPARSRETTGLHIERGYTGGHGEGRLPPGYVPRYGGLGDEVAERQLNRAAAYDDLLQQQVWNREAAFELAEGGSENANGSILSNIWERLPGASGGDHDAEPPPAAAAQIAGEAAQVQRIVEAFSDAGIFLWESQETRRDNLDIIRMIKEEVRACGKEATHDAGAGKPERILRQTHGGLKGSRRPDGTVVIGDKKDPDHIFDFNTVDTRPSQGNRLTTREAVAKADILALKREIDRNRSTRFDVYPKSRGKNRQRWRAAMRPRVRAAVRSLLNC